MSFITWETFIAFILGVLLSGMVMSKIPALKKVAA